MTDLCHYTFVQYTTPRGNPNVNNGLRVMMMCQWRSLNCNRCSTLVGEADSGEGCACQETGHIWELCAFISILLWTWNCCEKLRLLETQFNLFVWVCWCLLFRGGESRVVRHSLLAVAGTLGLVMPAHSSVSLWGRESQACRNEEAFLARGLL